MTDYFKEFLERCEKITREHEKHFLKSDMDIKIALQLLKMFEEVAEVQRAILKGDIVNMKEEICDVILASITMFHKFDMTPNEIMVQLELTLQKCVDRVEKLYKVKIDS